MDEGKARDRVPSRDSARERNAVFRPQEPAATRMDFVNGLLIQQRFLKLSESPGAGYACDRTGNIS